MNLGGHKLFDPRRLHNNNNSNLWHSITADASDPKCMFMNFHNEFWITYDHVNGQNYFFLLASRQKNNLDSQYYNIWIKRYYIN